MHMAEIQVHRDSNTNARRRKKTARNDRFAMDNGMHCI